MDQTQPAGNQQHRRRPIVRGGRLRGHGGPRTVLPSYPHHYRAETTSEISGSFHHSGDAESSDRDTVDTDTDDKGLLLRQKREFYPSLEDVSEVRNMFRGLWSIMSLRKGKESNQSRRTLALPDEVIDIILDEAEYWPSVVTTLNTTPFVITADGDRECLKTPPLCYSLVAREDGHKSGESDGKSNSNTTTTKTTTTTTSEESSPHILLHRGVNPCRKIVFDISSHDQGWGGDTLHRNTFIGSWTWFDAYIGPPNAKANGGNRRTSDSTTATTTTSTSTGSDSPASESGSSEEETLDSRLLPFLPEPTKLQCNRTATINSTDYHIVWHYRDNIPADSPQAEQIERETGRGRATLDGKAVRNMRVGDEVSVWLRARFAGWRNHVDKMSVRVFWAA